jgi:hypothetical protein
MTYLSAAYRPIRSLPSTNIRAPITPSRGAGGKTYCKPEADRAALSLTLGFFKQHLAKWIACGASIRNFGGVRVRAPKLILHRF